MGALHSTSGPVSYLTQLFVEDPEYIVGQRL